MKDFHIWKTIRKNKGIFSEQSLFIVSLTLFFVVVISLFSILYLQYETQKLSILSNPFSHFHPSRYPIIARNFSPVLTAEGASVFDPVSHVYLYMKNGDVRFSPASTTKMITALTALDYYHLNDVITVQRNYVEGSGLHLTAGEKFRFINLLYAMFLPSANDAAYAIADNYPGGMSVFVQKMNEKVHTLGLFDTHYNDPAGLDDDNDYTTPHDLAIIGATVMENPLLKSIVATRMTNITSFSGVTYPLQNLNQLLGFDGVNGIKTGTTDEAGEVLVTSDIQNSHDYILVAMKSTDRFADTQKLLQLITNNVNYLSMSYLLR